MSQDNFIIYLLLLIIFWIILLIILRYFKVEIYVISSHMVLPMKLVFVLQMKTKSIKITQRRLVFSQWKAVCNGSVHSLVHLPDWYCAKEQPYMTILQICFSLNHKIRPIYLERNFENMFEKRWIQIFHRHWGRNIVSVKRVGFISSKLLERGSCKIQMSYLR